MAHSSEEPLDLTATVDVNFDRKIASGGYGDVYKGRLTRDVNGHSGEVAVKVTRFIFAKVPDKVMKGIEQELENWKRHWHPYILPLIGVYLYQGIPCAVSPWCDSGTLLEYMKSAREGHEPALEAPLGDSEFDLLRLHCLEMRLLWEVAAGLAHLHERKMAHGDIKASNVLVRGGVAQLGDFGFSVVLAEHSGNTSSHLGTARWFAPESLEENAHRTREADVWAFGCVILEARTLLVPYDRVPDPAVPLAIRKDRPYEHPEGIHPSLWSLAEACWSSSPKARIASPTLATRIKAVLKSAAIMRKALGALPDIQHLNLGYRFYRNSSSTARFSLASMILKRDNDESLDRTVTAAIARNALRDLEAFGVRFSPAPFRPTIGLIAITSPQLAEQLMLKLSTPAGRSPLRGHTDAIWSVAFLPDSRRLVSTSKDTSLRIWDTETGETVTGPLQGHTGTVPCVVVHGSRIASCSDDGFCIWDADSGKLILGPIRHSHYETRWITYSRDGTRIATGDYYDVLVWDANTGVQLRKMDGPMTSVTCVAFSEDGRRLVSGSPDGSVRIWDVASGKCIGQPLRGHTSWVSTVCFSRDDKRVFSSAHDCTIRIWDVGARISLGGPLRMNGPVLCMALSPDGKRLVSGSLSGRIAMWDAQMGAEIPTPFDDQREPVRSVAFSPDGCMIASASVDTIALWDGTDDWKRWDIDDTRPDFHRGALAYSQVIVRKGFGVSYVPPSPKATPRNPNERLRAQPRSARRQNELMITLPTEVERARPIHLFSYPWGQRDPHDKQGEQDDDDLLAWRF